MRFCTNKMLSCSQAFRFQKGIITVLVFVSFGLAFYYTGSFQPYLRQYYNKLKLQVKFSTAETSFRENGRPSVLSFIQLMETFPWPLFKKSVDSENLEQIQNYSTLLVNRLFPYLLIPPTVPINKSCNAPPLGIPKKSTCLRLPSPRKVGMLLQFGFDVNALEIHLHELNDVVDKFFLIEAVKGHSMYTSTKPLVWEAIKHQKRFAEFTGKVVHLVVDDASLSEANVTNNIWQREAQQERLRWEKFLQWNDATNYFSNNDLLGFGDVDEIPNRNNVYFLKNCQLPSDPVDIGIWFPLDGLSSVFSSDWPVKGHPNTLANPTFWTFGKALSVNQSNKYPDRLRGRSTSFLLGGVHLSLNVYPPHFLIKRLTATEVALANLQHVILIGTLYASNQIEKANKIIQDTYKNLKRRIISLETFKRQHKAEADAIVMMPWLLACNLRRYPSFNKDTDARFEVMVLE